MSKKGGRIQPSTLAAVLAVVAILLFCVNGELLQALQGHMPAGETHASPLLGLFFCHMGGLALAPHFAGMGAEFVSPSAMQGLLGGVGGGFTGLLSSRPRITALLFALVLMSYNYAWLLSTSYQSVAVTNAIFQTSVAFVYGASVLLFGEPLTGSRMLGVVLALTGSLLAGGITHQGATGTARESATGALLAFAAAIGVAVYQVCFRQLFGHLKYDSRFVAFFSAWISIWHVVLILPLICLANVVSFEALKLPHGLHALVGTAISAVIASTVNLLYLCIALWGSPMLLPCTSVLIVPLSVGFDVAFHSVVPTFTEMLGHGTIIAAVALILNLQDAPKALRAFASQTIPGAVASGACSASSGVRSSGDPDDVVCARA